MQQAHAKVLKVIWIKVKLQKWNSREIDNVNAVLKYVYFISPAESTQSSNPVDIKIHYTEAKNANFAETLNFVIQP